MAVSGEGIECRTRYRRQFHDYNRPENRDPRRHLRKHMPSAEVMLWMRLRAKQCLGKKFRRQYGVGPLIIDFHCIEVRLAIELDGDSHFTLEAKLKDAERDRYIESFGIRVLRFMNTDIYENLDGVIEMIARTIGDWQSQL